MKYIALSLLFFFHLSYVSAQNVAINNTGESPNLSAILDVQSESKGILIPRMDTSKITSILNPAKGLMVFDTSNNVFKYYNGAVWTSVGDSPFEVNNGVVRDTASHNRNFVFGAPQLDSTGEVAHDRRFFFDKLLGAFRAGSASSSSWNRIHLGANSFGSGENTMASGRRSAGFGLLNRAEGDQSVVFGSSCVASGRNSFAGGFNNLSSGINSFTFGEYLRASGNFATAFGQDCQSIGQTSFAVGRDNVARGRESISTGANTLALGTASFTMGFRTVANSPQELAIGKYNVENAPTSQWLPGDILFGVGIGEFSSQRKNALSVYKNGQIIVGTSSPDTSAIFEIASSNQGVLLPRMDSMARNAIINPTQGLMLYDTDENSFVNFDGSEWVTLGSGIFVENDGIVQEKETGVGHDFVFGSDTIHNASATNFFFDQSHGAFRTGRTTSGQWHQDSIGFYSFASGLNSVAKGNAAVAMGEQTRAMNVGTSAFGSGSQALGKQSFAAGNNTLASGSSSMAFGERSHAAAFGAVALGDSTVASGTAAFSVGQKNIASGLAATALGFRNEATNDYTVAMGSQSSASSIGSFAMGLQVESSGGWSTALGFRTSATGSEAIAGGLNSVASGIGSMAMGNLAQTSGSYSAAFGEALKVTSRDEFAIGRYNDTTATSNNASWSNGHQVFSIGIGTSDTNRKNAMTVMKNGRVGIGISEPLEQLTVVAESEQDPFRVKIGSATKFMVHNNGGTTIGLGSSNLPPSNGLEIGGDAQKPGGGTWDIPSDFRLKENIRDYKIGIEVIREINPVTYHYNGKGGLPTSKKYVGIIAQEIQKISPDMVTDFVADDGNTYLKVDPNAFTYILMNAAKEMDAEVSTLKSEVEELKKSHNMILRVIKKMLANGSM